MGDFDMFIEVGREREFAEVLSKSNAKFKGYYQKTFWDGETQKGFIVNVDTKDSNNPIQRRRDYFIATEKIDGRMRLGKMEILAEEILHDLAVTDMLEGRGGSLTDTIVMSSLATSDRFELINSDTDFYDFVKCFCK